MSLTEYDRLLEALIMRSNKAVSDGAVSFYLDHFVRTRVAKFTYGQFCTLKYDPSNPDHVRRSANSFVSYAGEQRLPGYFDVILQKVC